MHERADLTAAAGEAIIKKRSCWGQALWRTAAACRALQAAVEMAETYLKYGKDPVLTKMAKDIVGSQKKEIAAMDKWMKARAGK